jgi:hypothetical protein
LFYFTSSDTFLQSHRGLCPMLCLRPGSGVSRRAV